VTNIQAGSPLSPTRPGSDRDPRLQQVVEQLQGVFVEQLFKAMRETVPTDGVTSGGPGEAMFSGMMDQHLADALPGQWDHGIGESLYRQLRPQVQPAAGPSTSDVTP
jgi:peptidoglycan hydrolase FlgJ